MLQCKEMVRKADEKWFPKDFASRKSRRCIPFHKDVFALMPQTYFQADLQAGSIHRQVAWSLGTLDKDQFWPIREPAPEEGKDWVPGKPSFRILFDDQQPAEDSFTTDVVGAFDFDGDGNPEFLVERAYDVYEGMAFHETELWTVKDGELGPYPKGPMMKKEELWELAPRPQGPPAKDEAPPSDSLFEDVDHDGRPDIHTSGAYLAAGSYLCGGGFDKQIVPPVFVFHSLPDGTFSATDGVAKNTLKRYCPIPPSLQTLFIPPNGKAKDTWSPKWEIVVQAVVCARAFGKTANQVLAEIGHGCDYIDDDKCPPEQRPQGVCPGWVRALAAIEPQVKLR